MVENILSGHRSQMLRLINESFVYKPVGVRNIAEDMIRVDCAIGIRYTVLNLVKFLTENSDKNIETLINTLAALQDYCFELLKSSVIRRSDWREINMKTIAYKDKIADIQGAEDILKMLGYVNKINEKLSFSEFVKEPVKDAVISILIDVIVAREELDSFTFDSHPHPEELQRISEARQKKDPTYNIIRSANSFRLQRVDSNDDRGVINRHHKTVEPLNLPPCTLCGQSKGEIECKDCACSHCVECDREWHMHPKRKNHKNRITKGERINRDIRSSEHRSSVNGNLKLGSSKLTSNEDSTKLSRDKSDYVLVPRQSTRSIRIDQITERPSNSTSSNKVHEVPEATQIYIDRLWNERQSIELKLGEIVKQLEETDKNGTTYRHLKIEQKVLRHRWKEIGNVLGDTPVTEQPRGIVDSVTPSVSSPVAYNDADQSLNLSFVKKNIRRPPSKDSYYEYQEMEDPISRNRTYTSMENKGFGSSLRNNSPQCIDNKPLEMVETHFSNNTPVGWKCQHCTFINRSFDTIICEMCSKTTEKEGRESSI